MLQPLYAPLLLISLGLIWGTSYVIAKFVIVHGVSPLGYSLWLTVGPAILLSIIAKFQRKLHLSFEHIKYYCVCGLIGIAIPKSIVYMGAAHLPAGLLSVIVNTAPILTYPLALMAQQEHFQIKRFIGIVIGITGMLLLILPKASLPDDGMFPWAMLTFVTPICLAICAVYIKKNKPKNSTPISLSAGMLISATIFLIPVNFIFGEFYSITFPLYLVDFIILSKILLTSMGYILFFILIQRAGPVYYSLLGGIICITGLLFGYILFDEHLNMINIFAISVILLAISIMSMTNSKKEVT